jgi:NADH:ubiquinone oxidoreductase subunit E
MKFKIGDKVMLKAVPYESFSNMDSAKKVYDAYKNKTLKVIKVISNTSAVILNNSYGFKTKYLKHAVKPKPVKYTIDCTGMVCQFCPRHINGKVKICQFTGTKAQVEAHIKRYWKQPKIKAVVK